MIFFLGIPTFKYLCQSKRPRYSISILYLSRLQVVIMKVCHNKISLYFRNISEIKGMELMGYCDKA